MAVFRLGGDSPPGAPGLIWAHGWGHTHANLLPLVQTVGPAAGSLLLDLPGFGASPLPPFAWSTADYADAAAEWLSDLSEPRRIWVGHSFGTRVGLQLAARHPQSIDGLFLIAAAGLPPRRSPMQRARLAIRHWTFRAVRSLLPEGPQRDRLRARFGSADYRQAAPELRAILVKAVNENLTAAARAVRCPTMLVYGADDRETPPEIGERLHRLIPQSRLLVLRGFDHWNVLTEGRHQIAQRLSEFMEQVS
jgi:pimeloyl-ACP methyl ester carboxylesterase